MFVRPSWLTVAIVIFPCAALPQAPAPASRPAFLNYDDLPLPPLPPDPLELVAGPAQAVENAGQRVAATTLLARAHDLSNVRAQPYDLKTSFSSIGGLASDGNWTLEDISPGRAVYRWSAQGPSYSAVHLYPNSAQGLLYSDRPDGTIPLRLLQVRGAIFFNYSGIGPQTSLRTAAGYLNGAAQQCVLLSFGLRGKAFAGGRNWEETEYCVNPSTGLLTTYSPVPGLFIHYDYSNAIQFHGKTIAGSFTISEAGRPVVEAKTLSVTDPPDAKSALFDPGGLIALGVGREMNPPMRSRTFSPLVDRRPGVASVQDPVIRVVVLHGNMSPDGHLSETELLASTDASLNQAALDRANNRTGMGPGARSQPGATAQSTEAIFTFEFVTSR